MFRLGSRRDRSPRKARISDDCSWTSYGRLLCKIVETAGEAFLGTPISPLLHKTSQKGGFVDFDACCFYCVEVPEVEVVELDGAVGTPSSMFFAVIVAVVMLPWIITVSPTLMSETADVAPLAFTVALDASTV